MSEGQAGIEVTPAMVDAGKAVYDRWEPEFVWGVDEYGGASDYARRELVEAVYRAMVGRLEGHDSGAAPQTAPLDFEFGGP